MMAKDRNRRFQRPAEVAKVLACFCEAKSDRQRDSDVLRGRPRGALSPLEAKAPPVKPSDVGISREGQSLKVASPSSPLGTQSSPRPWPMRYVTYWRRWPLVKVALILSLLVAVAMTITLVLMTRGKLRTDAPAASLAVAATPVPVPRAAPDANSLSSPSAGEPQSTISRLRDATVYLKAKIAGKTSAWGSGFVIESSSDSVLVVTNRHIAAPHLSELHDGSKPAETEVELEAVFHSGEGRQLEEVRRAEIIAVDTSDERADDVTTDLAFLIVRGVNHPPQPIDPLVNVEAREGMPYSSAGVPVRGMNDKLAKSYANPSVTITNGYITALERNDSGQLTLLQAIAPLLPYETGGPIVEEKTGRLIGVLAAMFVSDEFDLRLLFSVKDLSDIPTGGKDLIIVAAVGNVLHFRVFDRDGKLVVDIDGKRLTSQARQIESLGQQLVDLWPPHQLTASEKDRVITAVTSIVGYAQSDQTIISVVPAEEVRRCLAGRLGAVQLKWLDTSPTTAVEIKAQVVDPKHLVEGVLVRVAPAAGASSLAPDSDGNWPPLPNASTVELQKDKNTKTASGKVQVSLGGQDAAGRIILIQPAHRNGTGQVVYSKPIEFQPPEEEGPVIASRNPDRKPERSPEAIRFDFGPLARRPVRVKEKLDRIIASPRSHPDQLVIPAGMYEVTRSRYDRPDGPRKYAATERRFESESSRTRIPILPDLGCHDGSRAATPTGRAPGRIGSGAV